MQANSHMGTGGPLQQKQAVMKNSTRGNVMINCWLTEVMPPAALHPSTLQAKSHIHPTPGGCSLIGVNSSLRWDCLSDWYARPGLLQSEALGQLLPRQERKRTEKFGACRSPCKPFIKCCCMHTHLDSHWRCEASCSSQKGASSVRLEKSSTVACSKRLSSNIFRKAVHSAPPAVSAWYSTAHVPAKRSTPLTGDSRYC